jgi:hypothetical protein
VPSKPSRPRPAAVTLIPSIFNPVLGIEALLELLLEAPPVPAGPEVAVAEHGNASRWKHQIWPARQP